MLKYLGQPDKPICNDASNHNTLAFATTTRTENRYRKPNFLKQIFATLHGVRSSDVARFGLPDVRIQVI